MILSYVIPQTNAYNSLTTLNHLHDLNYYLSELAFLTIETDLSDYLNISYFFSLDIYVQLISDIEQYGSYLIDDYSSWSYCPSSDIINQNIIPVWLSNSPKRMIFENLVNVVEATIVNVIFIQAKSFIKLILNNSCCTTDYSFYIYFNTLTASIGPLQEAIDGLKMCESSRINDLTDIVYYLMLAGFSVLGINLVVIVWFLLKVDTQLNSCWNILLKNIDDSHSVLKGAVVDRLAQYHKIYKQDDEEEANYKSKNTKLKFNFYWKYTARFIILFIYFIRSFILSRSPNLLQ